MSGNLPEPNNAPLVTIPSYVYFGITPVIVGLRLWTRLSHKSIGPDDWTILVSFPFGGILNRKFSLLSGWYGFGKHVADLTRYNTTHALELFYFVQVTYKTTINLTKISIVLLYLRIFVQKPFRAACWAMIGFQACFGIATVIGTIFQCTPISYTWDKAQTGHCLDTRTFWFVNGGFTILTDMIIILLPMRLIFALNLRLTQKLSLIFIFSLGILVIITSILRMTTLYVDSTTSDPTYEITSGLWTIIENNTAIICASLPMLRRYLARLFPSLFSDPSSGHGNVGYSSTYTGTGPAKHTWPHSRIGEPDHNRETTIVGGQDSASEEYILQDRGDSAVLQSDGEMSIQKTIQVTVQYNNEDTSYSSENSRVQRSLD